MPQPFRTAFDAATDEFSVPAGSDRARAPGEDGDHGQDRTAIGTAGQPVHRGAAEEPGDGRLDVRADGRLRGVLRHPRPGQGAGDRRRPSVRQLLHGAGGRDAQAAGARGCAPGDRQGAGGHRRGTPDRAHRLSEETAWAGSAVPTTLTRRRPRACSRVKTCWRTTATAKCSTAATRPATPPSSGTTTATVSATGWPARSPTRPTAA